MSRMTVQREAGEQGKSALGDAPRRDQDGHEGIVPEAGVRGTEQQSHAKEIRREERGRARVHRQEPNRTHRFG